MNFFRYMKDFSLRIDFSSQKVSLLFINLLIYYILTISNKRLLKALEISCVIQILILLAKAVKLILRNKICWLILKS